MAHLNHQLLISLITMLSPSHKEFDLYVIANFLSDWPILSCCWIRHLLLSFVILLFLSLYIFKWNWSYSHLTSIIIRLDHLLHNVITSTRNIIELYCSTCRRFQTLYEKLKKIQRTFIFRTDDPIESVSPGRTQILLSWSLISNFQSTFLGGLSGDGVVTLGQVQPPPHSQELGGGGGGEEQWWLTRTCSFMLPSRQCSATPHTKYWSPSLKRIWRLTVQWLQSAIAEGDVLVT